MLSASIYKYFCVILMLHPSIQTEEVELTSESVNRDSERVGPDCFELLTVLGKGAYGKVREYACIYQVTPKATFSFYPLTFFLVFFH